MKLLGPLPVRLRTFRLMCGSLAVASLALAGTGTYLVSQWNKATEVELDEVLADFRSEVSAGAASTTSAAPAPGALAVPAADVTARTAAPPDTAEAAAPTVVVQPAPQGPAAYQRPPEGVYAYAGTGGESISIGGARHDYPAEVFATLRHTACGYEMVFSVLKEHTDTFGVCLDGTRMLLSLSHQRLTFFGQTDEGAFVCAPPVVLIDRTTAPGTVHPTDCTSGSLIAAGTSTWVRDEVVAIDDTEVSGQRVLWSWTASGRGTGSGTAAWIFDEHGLPLRVERDNQTTAGSVLGPTTHTESATFTLQSRTPRT